MDVALTSSNPTVFPIPASLHLEPGSACGSLVVNVGMVDASTAVTVSAQTPDGPRSAVTVVRVIGGVRSAEQTTTPVTEQTPVVEASPIAS
jgi:hypothetical protein